MEQTMKKTINAFRITRQLEDELKDMTIEEQIKYMEDEIKRLEAEK